MNFLLAAPALRLRTAPPRHTTAHRLAGFATWSALLAFGLSNAHAQAQASPSATTTSAITPAITPDTPHPWLTVPVQGMEPGSYFTNLRDGDQIQTPFLLKFGLSRHGLAGISEPVARAGHHHLLLDRDLPLDFTKPLPFDSQYLHFGKGQMETVLTLKPGTHTLRMLLADHRHIPYFVYSPRITVKVTEFRADIKPASLVQTGVSLIAPREGEAVKRPFRVQMHASGLNISDQRIKANEAGHFRLVFKRTGGPTDTVSLTQGHTEVWLRPPPGTYQVQVQFVRNDNAQVTHVGKEQSLTVQ
jgi:hypothetical protein